METKDAILGRRSVRAFLPDQIDEGVIHAILDQARWAPSWGNAQDWNVYAITGDALATIKAEYLRRAREGDASATDLVMPSRDQWPEKILARMNLPAAGEAFMPPPGPSIWEMYGAPALIVLAIDSALVSEYACFDAGLFAENVCLAAEDVGLSSIIMAVAVRHPDVLRQFIPDAARKRFVIGIAMGLAASEDPGRGMPRQRADLDDIVTWIS
jgi:nitroreductase